MDSLESQMDYSEVSSEVHLFGHRRRETFTNQRVSEEEREYNEIASPKPLDEMDMPSDLYNFDNLKPEEYEEGTILLANYPDQFQSVFSFSFDTNVLETAIDEKNIFSAIRRTQELISEEARIELPDELPLPPRAKGDNRLTLVLDLDETLIKAGDDHGCDREGTISIHNERTGGNDFYTLQIRFRPYVFQFLRKIRKYYEIVVFTAAVKEYAEQVVRWLNEGCQLIDHVRHASHTTFIGSEKERHYKDLKLLGRDMSKVFIIDNSPMVYAFNTDNAIPIKSWNYEEDDKELYFLTAILEKIAHQKDVRPVLRSTYHLEDIINNREISRFY